MLMAVMASTLLISAIASGAGSDPDIACGRPRAAGMTGVQNAARLDEHELHFAFGGGLVLDAFRHDEHFSCRHVDMPVPEVDAQRPLDHQECFVRFGMLVPDEVALNLDDLELVVVHLGDDFWTPLLVEQAEFFADIDGGVSHRGLHRSQNLTRSAPLSASISRASCGVAASNPSSVTMRRIFATCSALLAASFPGPI